MAARANATHGIRRAVDRRLVPVALGAWCAALTGVLLEAASWSISLALFAAAGCAGVVSHRRSATHGGAAAVIALTLIAGGAASGAVGIRHPERAAAASLFGAAPADGASARVATSVTVRSQPRSVGSGVWFNATTTTIQGEPASVPVAVRLDAARGSTQSASSPSEPVTDVRIGQALDLQGTSKPGGAGDPAIAVIFAREVSERAPPPWLLAALADLRTGFVAQAVETLPGPAAGLLPGLAIGTTVAIAADLDDAMRVTSLTHLVAVSGANCAIVAALVLALLTVVGAPRWLRLGGTALALVLFVALVTPEPSIVRAATMALIALSVTALGRPGSGVAALSIATTVLIIADPWMATSYGFVLSVAATGALLLLAGPLANGMARWMPAPLALAFAVPLAAQLVCGPIILLLAPVLPIYGVLANLIAGPAAPMATIAGMFACLVQHIPILSDGLLGLAWLPAAWIAQTALTISAFPGADLPWIGGWLGFAMHAVVSTAIALLLLPGTGAIWRRAHAAGAAVIAVVAGATAGGALLHAPLVSVTLPAGWSIAMCDVGQGDAVVLRDGDDVALIDTGPDPELLGQCLDRLGVRRIDLLVITHFDHDHVGGVTGIGREIGAVMHGAGDPDEIHALSALAAQSNVQGAAGMTGAVGEAGWEVIWPPLESRGYPVGNDTSLVLQVSGGSIPAAVFLGDLGELTQNRVAEHPRLLTDVDVVKVSHHGSSDQSSGLYDRLGADLALIGVGTNTYGHPTDSVLDLLREDGSTVARTDTDGLILVGQNAENAGLWWWREHPPDVRDAQ